MRAKKYCFVAILILLNFGCRRSEPTRVTVYPVTGRLLVGEKPAHGAEITLTSAIPIVDSDGRKLFPHATVRPDGSFAIQSYVDGDGAPAGEYKLTVSWPTVRTEGGEEIIGPDRLDGRYSSVQSPASTITVTEKNNTLLPIHLK